MTEDEKIEQFKEFLDRHEEVISVGIGAFIVSFFITLGVLKLCKLL